MPDQLNPSSNRISRRAILRSAGVTLALPWLESFAAKAAPAGAEAFPKRFGVVFLGCGVNEDHWGAEGSGPEMKLSKSLSPLEPLKSKINVIHGLFNKARRGWEFIRRRPAACLRAQRLAKAPCFVQASP